MFLLRCTQPLNFVHLQSFCFTIYFFTVSIEKQTAQQKTKKIIILIKKKRIENLAMQRFLFIVYEKFPACIYLLRQIYFQCDLQGLSIWLVQKPLEPHVAKNRSRMSSFLCDFCQRAPLNQPIKNFHVQFSKLERIQHLNLVNWEFLLSSASQNFFICSVQ